MPSQAHAREGLMWQVSDMLGSTVTVLRSLGRTSSAKFGGCLGQFPGCPGQWQSGTAGQRGLLLLSFSFFILQLLFPARSAHADTGGARSSCWPVKKTTHLQNVIFQWIGELNWQILALSNSWSLNKGGHRKVQLRMVGGNQKCSFCLCDTASLACLKIQPVRI